MRLLLCATVLAWACTTESAPATDSGATTADALDLRRTFPELPDDGRTEMLVYEPPPYTIPAFAEKQFCWFGTYEGPEVGIVYNAMYQGPSGHHVVMLTTNADPDDYPDGEVFDCTEDGSFPMEDMDPNFIGSVTLEETEDGSQADFWLPEGMGAVLKPGQRYVIQSHYVNYLDEDIIVNDRMVYGVRPSEEIETWAAPIIHVATDLEIPPGEDHELSFECGFDTETNVLFLGGHMHEQGTRFSIDHFRADGSESVLYDIPVWDPVMRDAPPFNQYLDAPLRIQAGERWRTNCAWFNTTDEALGFPSEMCVTFAMAYPARVALTCDGSRR